MLATVLRPALALIAAALLVFTTSATLGAIPEDQRNWLDLRMPDDERELLDSTVGFAPPPIPAEFAWIEGDAVSLENLRGRVVVLQSWSRASASGRAAPRRVQHLLKGFTDEDVVIVAVHTPEGADGLQAYVERVPIGVSSAVDTRGQWCDEMGIYRRPVTILIDRDGAIRFPGVTYARLADAVELLVNEESSDKEVGALPARDERLEEKPHPTRGPSVNTTSYPRNTGDPRGANDLRGKKGPSIHVAQWLANPPRDLDDKVVVVEFWATWCGPCIKGIPHLNELQEELAGRAVVIGVSNEDAQKVEEFLKRNEMNYSVACDPDSSMMQVVGNRGIPHCIVMSPDGIVRWQGHPAGLDVETLEAIADAANVASSGSSSGSGSSGSAKRWVQPGE